MKKLGVLFITVIILLSFAACHQKNVGSSSEINPSQSSGATSSEEKNSSNLNKEGSSAEEKQPDKKPAESQKPTESKEPAESKETAETQQPAETSKPVETQQPTETQKSTETPKPAETQKPNHTHSYTAKVTQATCTAEGYTTYTCSCGDTYKDNYTQAGHSFVNYTCIKCGETDANYIAYQAELSQLTAEYDAAIADLDYQISVSLSNIDQAQAAINSARGSLYGLSPSCPQWFLQQYLSNWQAYGDTYSATVAAQNAWSQQYYSQVAQLESVIATNQYTIQAEQTNIALYEQAISTLISQYGIELDQLNMKYGIY